MRQPPPNRETYGANDNHQRAAAVLQRNIEDEDTKTIPLNEYSQRPLHKTIAYLDDMYAGKTSDLIAALHSLVMQADEHINSFYMRANIIYSRMKRSSEDEDPKMTDTSLQQL